MTYVVKHLNSKVQFSSLERIHNISLNIDYEFTENNNWQIHWRMADLETLSCIDSLAGANFRSNGFLKHLFGFTCGAWNSDGRGYQDCVLSEMWRHATLYIMLKFLRNLLAEFCNLNTETGRFIRNTGAYIQIYMTFHSSRRHSLSFFLY